MEEAEQEQQRSGPWKRLYGSLCKKAAGASHLTMKNFFNNEGERSSNKTEELEEANLQLQKLHLDLMWKAIFHKTEGKGKTAQSKYHWYRSHKDQEQQTDLLSEKPERQDTDSAVLGLQLQKYLQDLKQEAAKHQTKTSFCLKVKLSSKESRKAAAAQPETVAWCEGHSPDNHLNASKHTEGDIAGVVWRWEWHGLSDGWCWEKSNRREREKQKNQKRRNLAGRAIQIQLSTSYAVEGDVMGFHLLKKCSFNE